VLEDLLGAVVEEPLAEDRWQVLADWLEEQDDPRRAELLRLPRRLLATCCEPERHPERSEWQARVVHLLAEGVRPCVPQRTIVLAEGVEMTFSFIPPGSFLMGSPEDEEGRRDEETPHRVTLTRGFWLGTTPVTQAQWTAVLLNNPSYFEGEDLPVEVVSWEDGQEFCRQVSQRVGKRCRLPSEAQWEYACRAGTTTPFAFGDTLSTYQANYDGHFTYGKGARGVYRERTTPVGCFPPNAWGLFDMHGNVWEWCADGYGAYQEMDSTDPTFRDEPARVLRGGSWCVPPKMCRSAFRGRNDPDYRTGNFGCRVLLGLD
jgi:uncharacterized protein (TIGR02996 family)